MFNTEIAGATHLDDIRPVDIEPARPLGR